MRVRPTLSRLPTLLVLLLPAPALAVDGVIEINQTCAVQTGCTATDPPGFPVTIGRGSYRLTSSLEVAEPATVGLDLAGAGATIDFNGFALKGDPTGALQKGVARQVGAPPNFVTLKNGTVEDFDGGCIELGDYGRVEDMVLIGCQATALSIGEHGQVFGNRIVLGSGQPLLMGASTAYRDNLFDADAASAVSGGISSGGNVCDGDACEGPRLRRFYRTTVDFDGAHAADPGNCAPGFHFASMFEIWDVSALKYDTVLGENNPDSGEGPPAIGSGWVRTGGDASVSATVGQGNCAAWTSNTGSGPFAFLSNTWSSDPTYLAPWVALDGFCQLSRAIWCVEDAR